MSTQIVRRLSALGSIVVLTLPSVAAVGCGSSGPPGGISSSGGIDPDASSTDSSGGEGEPDASVATYTIGGGVTGLDGATGLVLQLNGGAALPVSADGPFTFATRLASGAAYAVTVVAQPPTKTCVVTSGTGTAGAADVVDLAVVCSTTGFTIGGAVSGLAPSGSVVLNNGGDDLTVAANGIFTFTTPWPRPPRTT